MDKNNQQRGGPRLRAGRFPQAFHIKKEAARALHALTGHKQLLRPDVTEQQVLEELIESAWHDIDEAYQQAGEEAS